MILPAVTIDTKPSIRNEGIEAASPFIYLAVFLLLGLWRLA